MHILRLLSLFILLFSLSSFTESTNIKENIATKATVTVATTLTNKGNPKKKTYSPPKKNNNKTVASKKNNKIAQKRKIAVRHNAKRKTVASAKRRKATKKTIAPTQYAENTTKAEDIKDDLEDEELLEDEENQLSSSIIDYKIWCFNGTPHIVLLCYDRYNDTNGHSTATFDLYTLEPWQPKREFLVKCEPTPNYKFIPKPICLEKMLNMAKDLTKGFPVVRADFYIIKDKPYFGELTFTPAGGLNYSYSDLAQIEMGKMIKL